MTSSLLRGDGTNEPRDNLSSAADLFYVRTDRHLCSLALALSAVCPPFLTPLFHSAPSIPEGDVRSPFHFAPPAVRPSVRPARCFKTCFGVKLHFHTRYLFRSPSQFTYLLRSAFDLPIPSVSFAIEVHFESSANASMGVAIDDKFTDSFT